MKPYQPNECNPKSTPEGIRDRQYVEDCEKLLNYMREFIQTHEPSDRVKDAYAVFAHKLIEWYL